MRSKKLIPVLLGADIGIYSIARSFFEKYKIKSKVFCKCTIWTINYSKIIDYQIIENFDQEILKILIKFGKKNHDSNLILMTTIEKYVDFIISNKKELEKYYIIPYIDDNIKQKINSKKKFYNICNNLNIDYPNTIIVNKENYKTININFEYPIICKTNNTTRYSQISFPLKKKVFKINSKEELNQILKQVYETTNYDDEFCIQEFVPGDDTAMYVLTCYCDKNHDVVFSGVGQILLEEKVPGGIGNYSVIINCENEKILSDAKKFLKHIKYVGFANFDIKYDARTQKYNFFEINLRLGRSNYYLTGSGYNYTQYIVSEYINNKSFNKEVIATNKILYSIVPFFIIKKYVKNKELILEAKKLKKKRKIIDPTLPMYDKSFKRWIYIKLARINQIIKYKKYYK